jgi:hypothetical protein
MGMPPMEAVNSLYIVNGKITIYGMAMTKRLRENGWQISYDEKESEVTATIKKDDEEYSYTATKQEVASLSKLAYKNSPKDKMKWHCIGRLIRFYVPEVTGGTVSYLKEEIEDMPAFEMPQVKIEMATPVMLERLKKKEPDFDKLKEVCGLEVEKWEDITQDCAITCLTTLLHNNNKK